MKTHHLKKIGLYLAALGTALAVHVSQSQTTPTSLRLSDTVKQGAGTINLLKASDGMSASTLEALRQDNNGQLVFAVDINENASGLETAKSQGVAVESVTLVVGFASGAPETYTQFSTQTQALVATAGSTTRRTHYTLLGDSGSSRLTSSSKIGNAYFDSTLRVPVSANLSNATSAVLTIKLLKTDPALGDPENFYDYSGGYEDLAIVTHAVAKYLDEVLPIPQESTFRSEAPAAELSPEGEITQTTLLATATATSTPNDTQILAASAPLSWVLKPGASSYHIVAYEDRFQDPNLPAGTLSDYDFNDAVIAYRYQLGVNASGGVERISGEAYLIARGSNYTHDWSLTLPLPVGAAASATAPVCTTVSSENISKPCTLGVANGKMQWKAFTNTRDILPVTSNARPQRNTFADVSPIKGPKATFSLVFDTPVALADVGEASPLLYVSDTQKNITLDARDSRGFPYALSVPSGWRIPMEGQNLGLAYPSFMNFVSSSGAQAQNWYAAPDTSKVLSWALLDWAW